MMNKYLLLYSVKFCYAWKLKDKGDKINTEYIQNISKISKKKKLFQRNLLRYKKKILIF